MEPHGSAVGPGYRYWSFISYSHADERWARWLHRALETWRVPRPLRGREGRFGPLPERLFPVFRDRDELATSSSLPGLIREALGAARVLVVICSPRAAQSRWVAEEVRAFKALGRENEIFCVIVDGEPNASERPGSVPLECFPEPIRFRVDRDGRLLPERAEPLAADARPSGDGKAGVLLKLVAGILGVGLDVLRQRDEQRRRQRNRAWAAVGVVTIAALGIGIWYTNERRLEAVDARNRADVAAQGEQGARLDADEKRVLAERREQEARAARTAEERQKREALRQRDLAEQRRQVALARQLAAQAERIRAQRPDMIELSGLLGIEAAQRLTSLETHQALRESLQLLPTRMIKLSDGFSGASASFSPDGRFVLVDLGDRVTAYRVSEGVDVWAREKRRETPLRYSPDGGLVVGASPDGRAFAVRIEDGMPPSSAPSFGPALGTARLAADSAVTFSPDGRLIVVGGNVHDAATGALVAPAETVGPRARFAFDPSNRLIARAIDKIVTVLERDTWRVRTLIQAGTDVAVVFSPDGRLIALRGHQRAGFHDTDDGRERYAVACDRPLADLTFSSDGRHFALPCGNAARVHDASSGAVSHALAHDRPVASARFSGDGRFLLTASFDRTARLWDLAAGKEVWRAAHTGYVTGAEFNPGETHIVTAGIAGVFLLPAATGAGRQLARLEGQPWRMAVSADGRWLASAGVEPRDASVVVTDASSGLRVARFHQHARIRVSALAFRPDGRQLAVGGGDGEAQVVESRTGRRIAAFYLPDYPRSQILVIAFDSSGEQVLIAAGGQWQFRLVSCPLSPSNSGAIEARSMADPASGCVSKIRDDGFTSAIRAFLSPGSRYLAVSAATGGPRISLRVWDIALNVQILKAEHEVNDVAFSPDLRTLATADTGTFSVTLFNLRTGKALARLPHEAWVHHVAFAPDGRAVASAMVDPVSTVKNRVSIWDIATGEEIARFPRPGDDGPLMFSPDGQQLLWSDGPAIRIERWRQGDVAALACDRLTRNLTCPEWREHLRDDPYRKTCPKLPGGC